MYDNTEVTGRNWGIMQVNGSGGFVRGMLERYLPPGHRIIAECGIDDPLRPAYLIEGPDMPLVLGREEPKRVEIELVTTSEFGFWCQWEHMSWKRWEVPYSGNIICACD